MGVSNLSSERSIVLGYIILMQLKLRQQFSCLRGTVIYPPESSVEFAYLM